MDKEWSEKNKEMQALLSKEATFKEGIEKLLELRASVFEQITQIIAGFPEEAFFQMPFMNAKGYHSKTLSYSIWHIFRIEDIVAHEMVAEDEQILYKNQYVEKINSPIITTGNELAGDKIGEFSQQLDRFQLYNYAKEVMESTNQILKGLQYSDLKRKFGEDYKEKLIQTKCVDASEYWLIDYWCSKNVNGLIQMPFSRHWIMHVEAMRRIKNKLCMDARKGVDPIAYCGFSCNHCFLGKWCGSCRTDYSACSFATCFPDRKCPNVTCCKENGYDGCYECPDLLKCEKGFYAAGNDGALDAKAQAIYISKHGKKEYLEMQERLHAKYDFSKTQEILHNDVCENVKFLEDN